MVNFILGSIKTSLLQCINYIIAQFLYAKMQFGYFIMYVSQIGTTAPKPNTPASASQISALEPQFSAFESQILDLSLKF